MEQLRLGLEGDQQDRPVTETTTPRLEEAVRHRLVERMADALVAVVKARTVTEGQDDE